MHNQAGLFSAVNTAFIVAMLPNPVDTTNALLFQLTNIALNNSSSTQSPILYPSTGYFSSNTWTQALAYTSLASSLLAAFGAVMGKQWLFYYKTNRYDHGSLEDRCKRRHHKFQKLQTWHFEHVLQSFTILLQISLFLFAVSLAAALWKQQQAISILLIVMTALGVLCHVVTILAAVISPDCPFQTPFSQIINYLCAGFRRHDQQSTDEKSTADAIEWIIRFSTNPDVLVTTFELMTAMLSKPAHMGSFLSNLCDKLLSMLEGCFGITDLENSALVYGKILIRLYLHYPEVRATLRTSTEQWKHWVRWRDLYLRSALAQCQTSHCLMVDLDNKDPQHQAYTRTALQHMVVAAGASGFNDPDDECLVREGRHRLAFDLPDTDWLIECAKHFCGVQDYDAARYAIALFDSVPKELSFPIQQHLAPILNKSRLDDKLRISALCVACRALDYKDNLPCDESFSQAVLTAIRSPIIGNAYDFHLSTVIDLVDPTGLTQYGLTSCNLQNIQLLALLVLPAPEVDDHKRYALYSDVLIRYMHPEQPDSFRHTALRKACSARNDLVLIATKLDGPLENTVFSNLSVALTAAVGATGNQGSSVFIADHEIDYVRLIFALAGSLDWRSHLHTDGHIKRCIEVIPTILSGSSNGLDCPSPRIFYLTGILLRVRPLEGTVTTKNWWNLTRMAWCVASNSYSDDHSSCVSDDLRDDIEILEKLATETVKHVPRNAAIEDLESLHKWVGEVADMLNLRQPMESESSIISAVRLLKDTVGSRLR